MFGKSLRHIDEKDLKESNFILCANTIGLEGIRVLTNELKMFAVSNPSVILHRNGDKGYLQPTNINQQLFFYNEDVGSLYEKYVINSVAVTRQLDMRQPIDDIYKRRADLHGLSLKVAVNPVLTLYEVRRNSVDFAVDTLPSGERFYRMNRDETFGFLEDLLTVMSQELNFTTR